MPFGNYLPHPTEGTNLGSDDGTDDEGLVRSRPRSSTAWLGCMEHVFKMEDEAMNCMNFFNIYMFLFALCKIVTHTCIYIYILYIYINIMDADMKCHIRVHTCFSYIPAFISSYCKRDAQRGLHQDNWTARMDGFWSIRQPYLKWEIDSLMQTLRDLT